MAKLPSKTTLRNKADKLWSQRIREIGYCEKCGKTGLLNAHHIFGRGNFGTRYDLQNGVCLCPDCHKFNRQYSAHEAPMEFAKWILSKRGDDWYNRLKEKANTPVKTTVDWYYNQIDNLRNNHEDI